ncbi:MAG: translocation/assembly module TamB [Bacteroidales bacterium]|nr:translocation/assembly module TamB [Bacteroidales bacterium]
MSLFVAIQDPIIQNFAIRIAGGYISDKTGADVKIGRLYITPDFTIHLENLSLKDLKDNNLLKVEEMKVRPLMQEIINGDIIIDRVELNHAEANLITYEDEENLNLQFLIDLFASDKEKEKKDDPVTIQINKVLVDDLDFEFWNQNQDALKTTDEGQMNYAHIDVDDIHLDMDDVLIKGDDITASLNKLAAKEQSGFALNDMSAKVHVSSKGILLDDLLLETNNSKLDLDLHMLYPSYKAFTSFVDSVNFDSQIRNSEVLISDLGPFSKVLYDMPNRVTMQGVMTGPIQSFRLDQLKFQFGDVTKFDGSFSMEPINFFNGNHSIDIKKMEYSYDDLVNFHIPGPTGTIPLPDMLKPLGQGTITGDFKGSMEHFSADLFVTSEIGTVNADIDKYKNERDHDVYEGYVEAHNFNIGAIANASNTIGTINVETNVICRIDGDKDIDLDIEGNAYDAILLGNAVDEISMNGNLHKKQFNGKISIDDDELALDFKGRFDFSNPKALGGDFQADILSADLNKLNIIKDDPEASITASITADIASINNFNETEGKLVINDIVFEHNNEVFVMDELDARIVNDNLLQKRINVNCDYFDYEMAGKMDFATIVTAFKQYMNSYVKIPQWEDELAAFEESGKSSDQDFIIQLNLKNPKPITKMFMPSLSIAKDTYINGTFTSRSQLLNFTLRSKYVKINNIRLNNIQCRSQSSPRRSSTRLHLDEIILRDSTEQNPNAIGLDDFNIIATLRNDSIVTDIVWDDVELEDHNKASIQTSFVPLPSGGEFRITEANIVLNDTLWTVNPENLVKIDSSRIRLSNVELVSRDQSITVDGYVPNTVNDTLMASFNHFNIASLNFLLGDVELAGRLYGRAQVSNLQEKPTLFANLDIRQLGINKETFGDAEIISYWDNENESVNLDVGLINDQHKAIDLTGAYYTKREKDNLDFTLKMDELNIAMLSPFTVGIVERIKGYGLGEVRLKGELDHPQINGSLKIKDGACKVNFLNTYYTFSPTILVNDSLITFSDMFMTDTLGHSAMVLGHIAHDHLKDFYLNLTMYPNNFLAMATTALNSPSYYGTAIASGIVEVRGPFDDINLQIKARTDSGTVMTIPIGGNSSVKTHDFIVFVDKKVKSDDDEEMAEEIVEKRKALFNLVMDLDVDRDARIKIALPNNLGGMEAKGDGNIKLGIDPNDLSLIGEYIISDGSLNLNIQDLIHRSFSLAPGSSISWTGDPVNGTINVTGVYQTKASLSSLGIGDSTNMSTNNVKVECLVRLKNQLLNPDISFGFRLPNATEDLQQAVFSVIDTTNQADVFAQTLYLLAFNSFNYGEGLDGFGLVSGELSELASKLGANDLNINVNYKPGTDISNQEMTVGLKKQWFDDRLTIETNFGVIIPNATYTNTNTSIVGDVNIDYRITKDGPFSIQGFNRSNYNTLYYQYSYYKMAPYTQGIGVSYNKSFDKFGDLFKKQTSFNKPNRPLINRTSTLNQADGPTD